MVSKHGTAVCRTARTVVWEVETGLLPVSPTRFNCCYGRDSVFLVVFSCLFVVFSWFFRVFWKIFVSFRGFLVFLCGFLVSSEKSKKNPRFNGNILKFEFQNIKIVEFFEMKMKKKSLYIFLYLYALPILFNH